MQGDNNKDPLLSNKVAAAILAALILIFGLPQLTSALMGGGHHGGEGEELHLAYCCVDLETEAAAEETPQADLGTLLANASAAAGERRAALCKSCHTFGEGEPNSTGPNLWNVVGGPVAGNPGFSYTSALESFGGEWTYERLDHFIENSQSYVPGTAMVQRFSNPEQRADILAFLQTLSNDPVPFPEPVAAPAEEESADAGDSEASDAASDSAEEMSEDSGDMAGEANNDAEDDAGDASEDDAADTEESADTPQE